MPRRVWWLVAFALSRAVLAAAQGLPCAEFQVHGSTNGEQGAPAISADDSGRFVVAWDSNHAGASFDIFARRFGPSGAAEGPEFLVNTYTTAFQNLPSVAFAPAGGFVVTWNDYRDPRPVFGDIFGQRFDTAGAAQGPEFRVNTHTTGIQSHSSVAMDGQGRFVVAWISYLEDGKGGDIFAQRFEADGTPVGSEFRVNTYTTGYQVQPIVAAAPAGGFVVVWESVGQDGSGRGVFGQRFDAAGEAQGAEFRANTYTNGNQSRPGVAYGRNGDFLVVWDSVQDIRGQRFDATGVPLGPEFRVNARETGIRIQGRVAGDSAGGFVVVWRSGATFESDIFGRRVDANGLPQGDDFRINAHTLGSQESPVVAALPNRGFAAAWTGPEKDGSHGVFGSVECARFRPVTPCRLADTRSAPGPGGGPPLLANSARTFPVAGACGVPPDATAVALNATAVNATDVGDLRLFPAGQPVPLASSLNFVAGRTRANNAVVPLGADGAVTVQCDMPAGSNGTTDFVLDVFGYFKR